MHVNNIICTLKLYISVLFCKMITVDISGLFEQKRWIMTEKHDNVHCQSSASSQVISDTG